MDKKLKAVEVPTSTSEADVLLSLHKVSYASVHPILCFVGFMKINTCIGYVSYDGKNKIEISKNINESLKLSKKLHDMQLFWL